MRLEFLRHRVRFRRRRLFSLPRPVDRAAARERTERDADVLGELLQLLFVVLLLHPSSEFTEAHQAVPARVELGYYLLPLVTAFLRQVCGCEVHGNAPRREREP